MPLMYNPETEAPVPLNSTAKVLVYGEEKTMKTWWALGAASLGFNVTILDGDNSHHVVANVPDEWKKKIGVIKLVDRPNKALFHNFVSRIYNMRSWAIRESDGDSIFAGARDQYRNGESHVFFNPEALNSNDVLIIDSWSAFCRSMAKQYKIVNSKGSEQLNTLPTGQAPNYKKGEKGDLGRQAWEDYGWGKALSLDILGMLRGLPCHVVLVAHSQDYVVMEKVTDPSTGKETEQVKSSTVQPLGYSGPQGKLLGQFFSDILHNRINKMDKVEISTRPTFDVKAGSRILKPATYSFNELTWAKYFELGKAVYSLPEDTGEFYNSAAFEFLGPEGEERFPKFLRKASTSSSVEDGNQPAGSRLTNIITDKS